MVGRKFEVTQRLLFVVNVDWFFVSHRLPIALEAMRQGYEVHIAAGITDQRAVLESSGLVVHPLALDRSSTGLMPQLRLMQQMHKLFKSVQPDVVHLVTIKPVLLGGLVARLSGVHGVVAAISGLGFVFVARGTKAAMRRAAISCLYRLALGHRNLMAIFQNQDDCAMLTRLADLPASKATLIRGSGVDLAMYPFAPLPSGVPVVMLAARLLVDKGVREFVAAARKTRGRLTAATPVRFVLVGSIDPGNPASLTRQEITRWVEEGIVECWGHRTDMPEVLSSAHIVVLPSYREGLPKVLIEAAATGRAVVTTDVPGCRDAIDPDITGVLVPAQNVPALANAIEDLLLDPVRYAVMGRAGRALAESAFDQQQVVARHMDIYRQLADST
jgi:glycosyltransferase involved in cell wall biosynthesis